MSCGPLGFPNPLAGLAFLCDEVLDCWLRTFDTEEAFRSCVDTANSDQTDCGASCDSGDDGSAAAVAREACDGEADDTYDTCLGAAQAAFDSCVAPCDPPGPGTDCYTGCRAIWTASQDACHDTWQHSRSNCYLQEQIALAGIEQPDANCLAGCCSTKSDHLQVCKAPCTNAYNSANTAAAVARWTCVSGCDLVFWSGIGDDFIYDSDCTNTCNITQLAAIRRASNAQAKCNAACQVKYDDQWSDCASNSRCYNKCSADFNDADYACYVGGLSGWTSAEVAACEAPAQEALMRCNLQCCFDFKGANPFDVQAIECQVSQMHCTVAALAACPAPGTGEGEPCHDSGSPECTEAITEQQACLDAENKACADTYKGCIQAITSPNLAACGGCLGDIFFPDEE